MADVLLGALASIEGRMLLKDTTRARRAPPVLAVLLVSVALLWSCGGGGSGSHDAPALQVTTSALPNGQVGKAYSATLSASGGTAPLSWALTAGALPAGLTLGANGAISGTPTAAAGSALTFTVTDSASQSQSASLRLNISPANITVGVTPARAGLTVTQKLSLAASTNDFGGVSWSVSSGGGTFSAASTAGGAPVTFTAGSTAGTYTLTATSVTDGTKSASVTVAITDLAGVYTYHNDVARDGVNTREFALTTANVDSSTFGKLFSCPVDGAVYAQPLWVANLTIGGARRNVIFIATAHDSLYAFDADASPCVQLWHANLIDTSHGATAGEVTVPDGATGNAVGTGAGDIAPEVGVIGTPVIDPATAILYVVSKSMNAAATSFYQRLHAIDITSGTENTGSPVGIAANFAAAGGGNVVFSAQQENQRTGLALVGGVIYVCWGSHEDKAPWYGWVIGYTYNGSLFTRSAALNVSPNTSESGIWMAGGAPSADNNGHLYVSTGNGPFDVTNAAAPNNDYGDTFLQLSAGLGVTSWFTPTDQSTYNTSDLDFGSGGATVVLNLSSGPVRHLVVGGDKAGNIYLLNGDSMGGLGDQNALQTFPVGTGGFHGLFATPAFWNNTLYIAAVGNPMMAFAFDTSTNLFNPTPTSQSPTPYGFAGSGPSVSASGASGDAIVWGIETTNYCTPQSKGCDSAVLHAYDASNLATELWSSDQLATDAAGNAVKFTVPTVANGKVYVGTRGNNTGGPFGSTTVSGEVDVYGLKPD
jgi:hypothetical protein